MHGVAWQCYVASVVTTICTPSRARPTGAPGGQRRQAPGHGRESRRWARNKREARSRGRGGKGHSPLVGGSLARCLQRGSAPARAAAAVRSAPHLPAGGPRRHAPPVAAPARAGRAVLPRRASLTPRKDHNQGRTSSLRCGRSALILIFHGKNRAPSGRTALSRLSRRLLATSLYDDPAAELHEDASAGLPEHPAIVHSRRAMVARARAIVKDLWIGSVGHRRRSTVTSW